MTHQIYLLQLTTFNNIEQDKIFKPKSSPNHLPTLVIQV